MGGIFKAPIWDVNKRPYSNRWYYRKAKSTCCCSKAKILSKHERVKLKQKNSTSDSLPKNNVSPELYAWTVNNRKDTQQYICEALKILVSTHCQMEDTLLLAINMCATVESGDEKVVIEKNKCDACINMEHRREIPIYEDIQPYHFVEKTVAEE